MRCESVLSSSPCFSELRWRERTASFNSPTEPCSAINDSTRRIVSRWPLGGGGPSANLGGTVFALSSDNAIPIGREPFPDVGGGSTVITRNRGHDCRSVYTIGYSKLIRNLLGRSRRHYEPLPWRDLYMRIREDALNHWANFQFVWRVHHNKNHNTADSITENYANRNLNCSGFRAGPPLADR